MKGREGALKGGAVLGAVLGYGFLAIFLWLVTMQVLRWFRDGEWMHVGLGDFLSTGLLHSGLTGGACGRFIAWFDAPETWLGLHRAFELIPASFMLFAISILGNCIFIYCRDRLRAPA